MLYLVLLLSLWLPPMVQATVFWTEDFEGQLIVDANSNGTPWSVDACNAPSYAPPYPVNGCNPGISTLQAHSGTRSILKDYRCPGGTSCGTAITRDFPASSEYWMTSWWYTTSLAYPAYGETKHIIWRCGGGPCADTGELYSDFILDSWGPSMSWSLSNEGGSDGIPPCAPYGSGPGQDVSCNYYGNMNGAPGIPLNQWACVETHIKYNTPGNYDGVIEIFINNQQQLGYYNRRLNFHPTVRQADSYVNIYVQNGPLNGLMFVDDMSMGDTRMPCDGSVPPVDTTPPAPPSTPTLTVSGGGLISLTWTNGSDAVGVTGTAILRCTGAACTPTVTLTTINNGATVSYADASVSASTTYGYRLSNFDAAGNQSSPSAIAYATTLGTFRTQTLSDAFNRADSTELGASWDAGYTFFYGATTNLAIVNNQLRVATLGADSLETNNTTVANDQWAQLTFVALSTPDATIKAPGIMLRANAPGDLTGYGFRVWNWTGGNPVTRIERWDGLIAYTVLAEEASTTWQNGDKLRGEVEGTTLRLYQTRGTTDTLILSVTDSTYASGRVGLIHYVASGTLGDIQIDDFTAGEFSVSAPTPPAMTFCTGGSRVSTTCTYTGTPATIRVATEFGSVVEPLSSFPSGVYTFPPEVLATMTDFFCMYPRDTLGVENTTGGHCNSVPYTRDTSPPVLSNPLPTASLPNGTTSTQITATIDKTTNVVCRYDTTDIAYTAMQTTSAVTLIGLSATATVTGLVTGNNLLYMACVFTDTAGATHETPSRLLFTVNVAASTADTTLPSTVTNLVGTLLSGSQVELFWTTATDNVAIDGYNVYASVGAGSTAYVLEQSIGAASTRVVVNLSAGVLYNFVVKARDTSQNLSAAYSNIVTVTGAAPPDVTRPSPITGLRVTGVYKNSIALAWDQPTDDRGVPTVTIDYCSGVGCSTFVRLLSDYGLTELIVSLAATTSYSFRMFAVDGAGNRSLTDSEIVTALTLSSGLSQPRKPLTAARLPRN